MSRYTLGVCVGTFCYNKKMKKLMYRAGVGVVFMVALLHSITTPVMAQAKLDGSLISKHFSADKVFASIDAAPPTIEKPEWYKKQLAALQAPRPTNQNASKVFTYSIAVNGATQSNLQEFSQMASATLNDPRGWAQLGVRFQEVPSGGMFSLILSQASLLPTYSSGCSAEWSCRVGTKVIINTMIDGATRQ